MADKLKEDPPKELQTITDNQPTELVLIMQAIDKLGGENAESAVAVIKELRAMKRDQEKWDAEKEFIRLLAEFQAECPLIPKTAKVGYASKQGGNVDYSYAPLDTITKITRPLLAPRGFSVSWDTETIFEDGKPFIRAKVRLLHKNGHSIESVFALPVPDKIGNMTEDKRHSAIKTKATREAVSIVLGLVTVDEDTNGNPSQSDKAISKDHAADLESKCDELKIDKKKFLEYLGADSFDGIRADDYKRALGLIKQKEKAMSGELSL